MFTLTDDEVEFFNIPAHNKTRGYFIEGVDYDHWHFYPQRGTIGSDDFQMPNFTDGHDHGYDCSRRGPSEGWVPERNEIKLPVETAVTLLRELRAIQKDLEGLSEPKKGDDRRQARLILYWRLDQTIQKLGKTV